MVHAFPHSNVLVLGPTSIQSLLPSTLISQVEALLLAHRIDDAVDIAQNQRKKLQSKITVDEDEASELRYVYQLIGFQCFSETLFEDAGTNLFNGDTDPRLVLSYFPDIRGRMFNLEDSVDVFAGVVENMPREASIDEIILNYSPHLSPNTRTAPEAVELRRVLRIAADKMLLVFLNKWRVKRRVEGMGTGEQKIDEIIDTALAKLYARDPSLALRPKAASSSSNPHDLPSLLADPTHRVILSELEPVLRQLQLFDLLCALYRQRGEDEKAVEVWSKIADGEYTPSPETRLGTDPLANIFLLLAEKRDLSLIRRWAVWLVKRDAQHTIELLTSQDTGSPTSKRKGKHHDAQADIELLDQLCEVNPVAGAEFLEHLILQRRSNDPALHTRLAITCVDELLACIAEEGTAKLWRAKAASYASQSTPALASVESSFFSYFATTTPESKAKRTRLKCMLFLQGSRWYDAEVVRRRLVEGPGDGSSGSSNGTQSQRILKLEMAILESKLGSHRAALSILAQDLRDAPSAEAYCTRGGEEVVSSKTARTIAERCGLREWADALFPSTPTRTATGRKGSVKGEDERTRKELVMILLEVYMSGGESTSGRTAHLLDTQSMNLDVIDVLPLVPPNWPVRAMSTFLSRSFRRTLHLRHEGQIVKAVSAGQNLEVSDRSWLILREQGGFVEESADSGDEHGDLAEHLDEKGGLAEKIALGLQEAETIPSHEIAPEVAETGVMKQEQMQMHAGPDPHGGAVGEGT